MIYETIEVEQRGHVTHVLLNRPESMNAITPQMHDELQAANRDNRLESIFLSLTNNGR